MNKHLYFDPAWLLELQPRNLGVACVLAVCVVFYAVFVPLPIHAQDEPQPIDNRSEAHKAVVNILSAGRFQRYGEAEQSLEADGGSGFIIDPEGIVVTNAHVVNGGNLFEIYLYGESEPRNAVLLGVSECSDLAVLDIRGSGFPYLKWQAEPVRTGQAVIAAGYPGGDYVETSGRIVELNSRIESSWAAIDAEIGHTARLRPGNSGGPLLNSSGAVVGVNYARVDNGKSYAAIDKQVARPLVEQLRGGVDVDSIGINGEAFDEGGDAYGVWVTAVKTGSPADKAGLQPGDIITALEGLPVGYSGGMGAYCDILRSHKADAPIAFDALRSSQAISGQFSGQAGEPAPDQPVAAMEPAATPEEAVTPEKAVAQPDASAGAAGYHLLSNKAGTIVLSLPADWEIIADEPLGFGSLVLGPSLVAGALRADGSYAKMPGISVLVWSFGSKTSVEESLDTVPPPQGCTFYARQQVYTMSFTGVADIWTDCSDIKGHSALTAVLSPTWNPETQVEFVLNRLELVESFEKVIEPLSKGMRSAPQLYDIPSATITADSLNLRSGPGTDYDKVTLLTAGDKVVVFGRDSAACEWYFVGQNGTEGWISADPAYVVADHDCDELETITAEMIKEWQNSADN